MRHILALALSAALIAGCGGTAEDAAFGGVDAAATAAASPHVATLGQEMNAARAEQGLAALRPSAALSRAAQGHAADLAASGRIDHRGSDGSSLFRRVRDVGFPACLTAENLAWGFPDPARIMEGWLASPEHRRNIMLTRATHYGAGVAEGPEGPVWVMVYARAC